MAEQAAHLAGMAFIPYYNQIIKLLECDQSLKRTIVGMAKQMGYAAAGAACGGVVGGPAGAMIGGIAGSLYGYMHADNYTALITVLKEMSDKEKQELVQRVQELVGSSGIEALTNFVGLQVNRELFAKLIRDFTAQAGKGGSGGYKKADNYKAGIEEFIKYVNLHMEEIAKVILDFADQAAHKDRKLLGMMTSRSS